jgi:hypothetical protein
MTQSEQNQTETNMETYTIEIKDISPELLRKIDEKARLRGADRGAVARELIEKGLEAEVEKPHAGMSFQELLAPVQRDFEESGMTEEELDTLVKTVRKEIWQEEQKEPLTK